MLFKQRVHQWVSEIAGRIEAFVEQIAMPVARGCEFSANAIVLLINANGKIWAALLNEYRAVETGRASADDSHLHTEIILKDVGNNQKNEKKKNYFFVELFKQVLLQFPLSDEGAIVIPFDIFGFAILIEAMLAKGLIHQFVGLEFLHGIL